MKFSIPFNQAVFRIFRLFVVTVEIGNRGSTLYLLMILDTGASYVTVRPDVFDRLDIDPIRNRPLVTASEQTTAPIGQVERISVGSGCSCTNVQLISTPLPAALPAEGLLGASFLRNYSVTLDYNSGKIELNTR